MGGSDLRPLLQGMEWIGVRATKGHHFVTVELLNPHTLTDQHAPVLKELMD